MKNCFRLLMILAAVIVVLPLATPAFADTVFFDGTFNLSNYTINSYPTNGDTVTITQTFAFGNPPPALEAMITAPASGSSTSYAFTYALNDTFVYNPSVQGTITSISFSIDRDIASITGASLGSEAGTSIIFQAGNYYQYEIPLPPEVGVWQTASATGLVASDYDLITDLTTDALDAAVHPNFAAGPLTFGEKTGWTDGPGLPATTGVNVSDNLYYDIVSTSTVPEPTTFSLISFGLIGAALSRWKHKR
jgi:hypothetical protein